MRVHIAGIAHSDPLGRDRLEDWLKSLRSSRQNYPEFIAVEWDRDHLGRVVAQRPLLRQLAEHEWPGGDEAFYSHLELACGFEGDTHSSVFPEAETLWLDEGRLLDDPTELSDFAHFRMNQYRNYICGLEPPYSLSTLHVMSERVWSQILPPPQNRYEREKRFADRMISRLSSYSSDWCICIVGVHHSSTDPQSMRSLIEASGFPCDVCEMRP